RDRTSRPCFASHTLTGSRPTAHALRNRLPSGLQVRRYWVPPLCSLRRRLSRLVAAAPSLIVLFPSPLRTCLPSGLHATLNTRSACPLKETTSWPLATSQTFSTVPELLPVRSRLPSGLHRVAGGTSEPRPSGVSATEKTARPFATSHIFRVF